MELPDQPSHKLSRLISSCGRSNLKIIRQQQASSIDRKELSMSEKATKTKFPAINIFAKQSRKIFQNRRHA